jgi:hypothetical protein
MYAEERQVGLRLKSIQHAKGNLTVLNPDET